MLKIYVDTTENFKPWSGAVSTYETIEEENKLDEDGEKLCPNCQHKIEQ